jgi:hypothetical protein
MSYQNQLHFKRGFLINKEKEVLNHGGHGEHGGGKEDTGWQDLRASVESV